MMQGQQALECFFSELDINVTPEQLNVFLHFFVQKHLAKDDFFIREGSVNHDIFFILKGIMRSYIVDEEGNETNLDFYQENKLFSGSYSFGLETIVNVQCLEDCTIIMADGGDFISIINSFNPTANVYNCTLDNIYKCSMLKLASYIRLSGIDRYKLFLENYHGLANRIPLYHIANHLGISPVQLSRIRATISKQDT
jgi:CRP-like cAMP-binding protein